MAWPRLWRVMAAFSDTVPVAALISADTRCTSTTLERQVRSPSADMARRSHSTSSRRRLSEEASARFSMVRSRKQATARAMHATSSVPATSGSSAARWRRRGPYSSGASSIGS